MHSFSLAINILAKRIVSTILFCIEKNFRKESENKKSNQILSRIKFGIDHHDY